MEHKGKQKFVSTGRLLVSGQAGELDLLTPGSEPALGGRLLLR